MRVRRSQTAHGTSAATPSAISSGENGTTAKTSDKLEARFFAAMSALGFESTPEKIALALSGGGDSVALLHLLKGWADANCARGKSTALHALIVDHGLRKGSGADAKRAAAIARKAGWHAHVLEWTARKPKSNIENAAREARYALLGRWCKSHKAYALFVAHTCDDLVETFLLRLGRGSGVDGLSAMSARPPYPIEGFQELSILRPLLDFGRDELRNYLQENDAAWIEDPMNSDPRFSRVKVRALVPLLEEAGIPRGRIAAAARHLARARAALEADVAAFFESHTRVSDGGAILMDGTALERAPREIALRALSSALNRVTGHQTYRPRFERLEALYGALSAAVAGEPFRARTLGGCRIGQARARDRVFGSATLMINAEKSRKTRR
jgi:tRNA(Ile)-lysidine synthase